MLFSIKSLAIAAGILSVAQGAALAERATSGKASTYGGNTQGGACSFSTYTLPSGVFGTALSSAFWAGSANCGRCVSITGPKGNKITAMVCTFRTLSSPESQINQFSRSPICALEAAQVTTSISTPTLSPPSVLSLRVSSTSLGTTSSAPSPHLSNSTTKKVFPNGGSVSKSSMLPREFPKSRFPPTVDQHGKVPLARITTSSRTHPALEPQRSM